jgi:hypothetical protein
MLRIVEDQLANDAIGPAKTILEWILTAAT